MNTFLPYPDFEKSAKCLDSRRLGKQRVEVLQLLNGSWANHPASKMWLPTHRYALAVYGLYVCVEWQSRGFKDTCYDKIKVLAGDDTGLLPPWFGDCDFHSDCRANLLRKDPVWYGQFGWSEQPKLGYRWPRGAA